MLENEVSEDNKLTAEQKEDLDKWLFELENGIGRTYNTDEVITMTDKALADKKLMTYSFELKNQA